MNFSRLTKGLIILYVGVIFLLSNMDIIDFSWWHALSFWPVLLILIGINLLLPKRTEGQILSVMATLVALVFLTYQGLHPKEENFWSAIMHGKEDGIDTLSEGDNKAFLIEPMEPSIRYALLEINAGAVALDLGQPTENLIDVNAQVKHGGFLLSKDKDQNGTRLKLVQKQHKNRTFNNRDVDANRALIRLNTEPIWTIQLKLGAGDADFDLRPFKISRLDLEVGVSAVNIQLGMPAEAVSHITIEGGLASFELKLPKAAGCRIQSSSALSSLDANGFSRREDGTYVTDNYDSATKKIEISLENGLSSMDISRY